MGGEIMAAYPFIIMVVVTVFCPLLGLP